MNAADDDNDDNNDIPSVGNNNSSSRSNRNRMEICPLRGDAAGRLSVDEELSSNPSTLPEAEICQGSVTPNNKPTSPGAVFSQGSVTPSNQSTLPRVVFSQGSVVPQNLLTPKGISKLTELTLDQFKNNFRLFAQKLVNVDSDLVIRVILLKNNAMYYNYTFNILGSSNVHDAIIASTCKVCTTFLDHTTKGDTLLCSLGAGHISMRTYIIRNVHILNLISILNGIKDKTGLYILMEGSKYDWLEYANADTINEDLFVAPKKTVIIPTINSHLVDQWVKKWENTKGHAQTKYWLTMPNPILASKLLNMSREHLGWFIQFFTGHGWWKKHLKLSKLCNKCVVYANHLTLLSRPYIYFLNAPN